MQNKKSSGVQVKDDLIEGKRLRLRRADISDLNYIMALEYAPENLKFIYPFDEDYHKKILNSDNSEKMDVIIEEIETGAPAGYFMFRGLDDDSNSIEWTHVIIGKKGLGYGREAMKLLKKWTFEIKKFHRAKIDCKDYNDVALHLYETEGLVREGVMREALLTNGVYENLVLLGILDREYFARKEAGKEEQPG